MGAAHACPPQPAYGWAGPRAPRGVPCAASCTGGSGCFVSSYDLLRCCESCCACVTHTHACACAACGPAGPSQLPPHTPGPAGFTRLWAVASLPSRKASSFILELVLNLTAAQSLTAVLVSDLKLLDSVTLSSLGRSVFIIIVSKEGLGDY